MHKTLFTIIFFYTLAATFAQKKDAVLLNIEGKPVYTSEFRRVYLKNIDLVKDESQKDIDEYLDLFIDYKLKLREAKALGMDKDEKYLSEFEGYKKQLASGYLTDNEVSDQLVQEAYNRMKERVNASHILLQIAPTAIPKDTLEVYQKMIKIRDSIVAGSDFNELAKRNSEDPSAVDNGGDLGWFSAFRMVYPFEDAAFSTKVGELSMPFRTRFGYHVVKVNDKEPALGEVTVAHIMIAFTPELSEEEAKIRIDDIEKQLKNGASFESLAKQYSDDKNTAVKGGEINKFGQGVLNSPQFEKVAFSLKTPGEVSNPVKTNYGWHLIKLIQKHPLPEYDKIKGELTQKIKRDSRSQMITDAFTDKLREKYTLHVNKEAIDYFKAHVPKTIFQEEWQLDSTNTVYSKELFKIENQVFTYKDFATYLKTDGLTKSTPQDVALFVSGNYTNFENAKLLQYYEEHLEEDNQDFAEVLTEYRDGLLLFDLMEHKVWNVAKTDSLKLKAFYENNKGAYKKETTYKIIKASASNQNIISEIEKMFKAGAGKEKIVDQLAQSKLENDVIWSEEEVKKGDTEYSDQIKGQKGEVVRFDEGKLYTVVKVQEVIPEGIKTFDETKGKVISDYQEQVEKQWMQQLREKYKVKVNQKTLKSIKKQLAS